MLDKLNHLKDEMCDELMELTDKRTDLRAMLR